MKRLHLSKHHLGANLPTSINSELVHKRKVHKGRFLKKFLPAFSIVAAILVLLLVWYVFSTTSSVFQFDLLPISNKPKPERVNILLLGIAGENHDGPNLTDSIIVASYHIKTNKVVLISVPRDLWLDRIKNKVNAAYEIGMEKKNGGNGLKFAEDVIDDIIGVPIEYGVRLDFNGFSKAVDLVEGVDLDVAKTFDDYNFPIDGKEYDLCGYQEKLIDLSADQIKTLNLPVPLPSHLQNFGPEPILPGKKKVLIDPQGKIATEAADFSCRFKHIRFEKGRTHMDGATALNFVRSRMGTNGEGSDFARSRRQQLVLQAFREKVLSLQTLINPSKLIGLFNTFGKSVETDIPAEKFAEFYNLAKKTNKVESIVLGDLGEGKSILLNPSPLDYGGAWVLIPPNNDFSSIQEYIKKKLDEQAVPEASSK